MLHSVAQKGVEVVFANEPFSVVIQEGKCCSSQQV